MPANTAHFTLEIPSVRNDFKVLGFHGTETISSLYAIQVELVSEDADFASESLLGQPAFLQFGRTGEGLHSQHHGYSAVDHVMRWASIYAVLGDDFPNAAEHAVYRQILDEKGVLPAQRLDNLSAALRRQLFTAKELSA